MSSFIRFAGAAAVILSLGLFVSALPLSFVKIQAATGLDVVSCLFKKLIVELELEVKIKALLACKTIAEAEAAAKVVIALLQICADDLLKIGAGVQIQEDAKMSLVVCVASIITLLVQVLVQVCLKFGIAATLHICAQIDTVVRLWLDNLDICIIGVVSLVVKAVGTVILGLCAQVKLDLCLQILTKASGVAA
ncbi:unnamed protein product [Rhizoctonia solani]|uniref:Uncharacterized protein n=1 Tax=Rhizoctonia solani TaxID=456999 RepID=A0A8H3GPM2_9AGAM|nr:unnamed protein product [Rhizoctonia solani]